MDLIIFSKSLTNASFRPQPPRPDSALAIFFGLDQAFKSVSSLLAPPALFTRWAKIETVFGEGLAFLSVTLARSCEGKNLMDNSKFFIKEGDISLIEANKGHGNRFFSFSLFEGLWVISVCRAHSPFGWRHGTYGRICCDPIKDFGDRMGCLKKGDVKLHCFRPHFRSHIIMIIRNWKNKMWFKLKSGQITDLL